MPARPGGLVHVRALRDRRDGGRLRRRRHLLVHVRRRLQGLRGQGGRRRHPQHLLDQPAHQRQARSFFIEAFETTIFLAAILCISHWGGDSLLLVAICVGLLVWAIGMGLGGMTGFAMNQARDLGPRLAYQVLPIKGKVDNNWRYGLVVPGLAPFVGSFLAVALVHFLGLY
ncbi:MAG: aquaporin [Olsenella sp.]